jgi:hypothetical protein
VDPSADLAAAATAAGDSPTVGLPWTVEAAVSAVFPPPFAVGLSLELETVIVQTRPVQPRTRSNNCVCVCFYCDYAPLHVRQYTDLSMKRRVCVCALMLRLLEKQSKRSGLRKQQHERREKRGIVSGGSGDYPWRGCRGVFFFFFCVCMAPRTRYQHVCQCSRVSLFVKYMYV